MNLTEFLAKAKSKTFASPFSVPKGLITGHKRYEYSEGGFSYVDSYEGTVRDHSREVVSFQGDEIWEMESKGGMASDSEDDARKCFAFLKKSLRNAPREFPIRGPRNFREGSFAYTNDWRGNIGEFEGEEKIFRNGNEVYSRTYKGGVTAKSTLEEGW